ncbi:unnamed protein product [Owenia fusiformis]|uniref:Uncharacterized protein n=1 Tax=Owenia fusiformis TaxID=6347 RepID=A0A8J1U3L9_OWEFU|nr:unnamed protein product [Owenia fusiformis]
MSSSFVLVPPRMAQACKECGCNCSACSVADNSLDLHHRIEELTQQLRTANSHMSQMQQDFDKSRAYTDYEVSKVQDDLTKLRDRYDRLFEAYKTVQKVNQNLEEKLLSIVIKFDDEKTSLQKDITAIQSRLIDAKVSICELEEENEKYRTDCNAAVQLLQCKPSNFVAHRLNTLPLDLQERVKSHMTREQILNLEDDPRQVETRTIRLPMPTFPPTAMVYQKVPSQSEEIRNTDTVPMTLIAKVLTHPSPKRKPRRLYVCQKCKGDFMVLDKEVQTVVSNVSKSSEYREFYNIHRSGRTRQNSIETEI